MDLNTLLQYRFHWEMYTGMARRWANTLLQYSFYEKMYTGMATPMRDFAQNILSHDYICNC